MSVSNRRDALAEAIANRDVVRQKRDNSAAALERATALLRQAQSELDCFSSVDDEVARARAAQIRAGTTAALPTALLDRKKSRAQAKEAVEDHARALELLANESNDTDAALIVAERAIKVAAEQVLVEEARSIAQDLKDARERVWQAEDSLRALAGFWPMGLMPPRCVRLPREIIDALHADQRPQRAGNLASAQAVHEHRWRERFTSLCADAAATN